MPWVSVVGVDEYHVCIGVCTFPTSGDCLESLYCLVLFVSLDNYITYWQSLLRTHILIYLYMYMCVCMCLCVCLCILCRIRLSRPLWATRSGCGKLRETDFKWKMVHLIMLWLCPCVAIGNILELTSSIQHCWCMPSCICKVTVL